jgi:hypothetical protein
MQRLSPCSVCSVVGFELLNYDIRSTGFVGQEAYAIRKKDLEDSTRGILCSL